MSTAALSLILCEPRARYLPGETLTVEYSVDEVSAELVEAVEISVLWFTEGKGDEDMAVHYFARVENDAQQDFSQSRRFSTVLPNSPLSYEGVIVKIHWCVRVRAFLERGKQLVEEQMFRLGEIPPAHAVLP
ncbi:MAG: hypothetical protein ABUL64_00805 [Singulisphaera sp.]